MTAAIAAILPYAVGAAVSPLLLTIQIVILAGGVHPKRRAWLYTAGAAVVAAVIIALLATLFQGVTPSASGPSDFQRGVEITAAVILCVLALRSFLPVHASADDKPGKLQEWVQHASSGKFFFIGMIMMATNASSIIMLVPGIHAVEVMRPGLAPAIVALSIALVLVMLPALIPVGLVTLLGSRSNAFLQRLNEFATKHSRTITGCLCIMIAAFLLVGAFS